MGSPAYASSPRRVPSRATSTRVDMRSPLVVLLALSAAAPLAGAQSPPPEHLAPARFADADRAAKLGAAFPEIDRVAREYAAREHIPGAAWAVVIDGRLAHAGTYGVRDVASGA